MQTRPLAILIRTFSERKRRALFLKTALEQHFECSVFLIDVQSKAHYSQGFIIETLRFLESYEAIADYFLIVEDDMLFSKTARTIIDEAIFKDLPHLWCSIPEHRLVSQALPLSSNIKFIFLAQPIYYSGAILFEKSVLKDCLTEYCISFLELAQPNADVFFSSFLTRANQPLFVSHNSFATDKRVSSTLSNAKHSNTYRKLPPQIDHLFDFSQVDESFLPQGKRLLHTQNSLLFDTTKSVDSPI